VISVSHKRTFTGALRRAIEVRDRHCQHPSGCDEPADRCDVDHIQPHSHGGETSQHNGRLSCWPHNRDEQLRSAHPPDSTNDQPTAGPNSDQPDERGPPGSSTWLTITYGLA
jgi:HNH endonuclease